MGFLHRRSFLGFSLGGAGAALTGLPSAAAVPIARDEADHWIIDDTSAVADTESGKVMGYIRGGIRIFKGIPYGEILSTDARWRRAAKPKPWAGKRSCRAPGPACPSQAQFRGYVDEYWLRDTDLLLTHTSEDCLRVNVWTPGLDNKKRQVLFWCHGGGFSGSSPQQQARLEAHNLAGYGDVVVVSMTHRLHALGYLDLTAYGARFADSANLGMLDIVDALKWVRANIANFGGDPGKVMVFGQSGGGAKVAALLAMPEAKGLFSRAVMQSPGTATFSTPDQSAALTAKYLKLVDVSPNNIDALFKLPLDRINAASRMAVADATEFNFDLTIPGTADWQPVIDGRTVLYDPPTPTIASDVPLLIGSNLHELFGALEHPEYMQMKEPEAREIVRKFFGAPLGDGIYDIYKGLFPRANPYELSAISRSIGRTRSKCVKIAQRRAVFNAAPTYNYWFQWRANTFEGRAMSHHELEIPLVYMNSDAVPTLTGGTAQARALSLKMADVWLAFARTGNPNIKALPHWNPVTPNAVTSMVFDNNCRIDHGSDLAAIDMFWKHRYPKG